MKEPALPAAVLADHAAEMVRFGCVLRDGTTGIIEFADDVVLDWIPEVMHAGHSCVSIGEG